MAKNTIYFVFIGPPGSGGDFVTLDHIVVLNRLGFDARALYAADDQGFTLFPVPVVRTDTVLKPHDIVVMGENQKAILDQLRHQDSIQVLHNQNPYYTFFGFDSVAALNAHPFARIIVPSDFCAARLKAMGVTHAISRVRPALPSYFAPGSKRLQIAYGPRKRWAEANYLKGYFAAKAPEFAHVPWVSLLKMTREECARHLADSAVYAAFAHLESLGLMSLEAMASGCRVVGYTGLGGAEYASAGNGDWVAEGDHEDFIARLRAACQAHASGVADGRIEAGRATAARFSREVFLEELTMVWASIMGERAALYRK